MIDGCRTSEISVHVTVTAKSKYHLSLIVISKETTSVTVKTDIYIILKTGDIRKIGSAFVTTTVTHIQVTNDVPVTVSYQNIITDQVNPSYYVCTTVSDVILLGRTGTGVDKALMIHVQIVIFCRNKGSHQRSLFLGGEFLPDIICPVVGNLGSTNESGECSVSLIFNKSLVNTGRDTIKTISCINGQLCGLENQICIQGIIIRFGELHQVVQILIQF